MTSKEYREKLHEILAQLIFRLQEDEAAGMLNALDRRLEDEGVDED